MKQNTFTFVFVLLMLFPKVNIAQQDQFLIGAYMHSTPFNNPPLNQPDSALFSLWRAKALGINTALIRARLPYVDPDIIYQGPDSNYLNSNMETAREFENVIAMNQSSSIGVADGTVTNDYIRNFDWIFFYTGAYYSKWDATLESINAGVLGLKHDIGFKTSINGIDYWSSGIGGPPPQGSELFLVKGPNYNQETRYRSSTKPSGFSDTQTYKVYYNFKLASTPPQGTLNDSICEIIVKAKYTQNCDWNTFYDTTLASKILTVGDIGNFDKQYLEYNYSAYCPNNGGWKKEFQIEDCQCAGKYLDNVEFLVRYIGNQELLINYIEVYDMGIWWPRLGNPQSQIQARQKIVTYLQRFKSANPQFYKNNLKYFFGVDEPHTVDAYIPHAFVQSVLDSLNNAWSDGAPLLFTHLYPEWNGQRNDADVFPLFVNTVKPKPLHFYYGPFHYNAESTAQSLDNLRNIFRWAFEANGTNDFYFTMDVWDQPSIRWRGPTPNELNASIMLALSHGAKGILYEPFYSYTEVGGLLEPDAPYVPNSLGIKVRDDINPRLSGILGSTLLKLKYSGNEICFRQALDVDCWFPGYSDSYLRIFPDPALGTNNKYDFNATFLFDPNDIENRYFMVTNSLTAENKVLNAELDFTTSDFDNIRLHNIEGGLDITVKDFYNLSYNFPAG